MKVEFPNGFGGPWFGLLRFATRRHFFVLGDGRSGTTWLAQIINHDRRLLQVFEPCHGRRSLGLPDNRMYPTEQDIVRPHVVSALRKALGERLSLRRLFYLRGFVIKSIASQLVLPRIPEYFGRILIIVRNPVPVALSKAKFGSWHDARDVENLLDHSPELRRAGDRCLAQGWVSGDFLRHVFVWCLLHRIMLPWAAARGGVVVYYEDMLLNPERAIADLFDRMGLGREYAEGEARILKAVARPSATATAFNTIGERPDPERPWEARVPADELAKSRAILREFGLDGVYGESFGPLMSPERLMALAAEW